MRGRPATGELRQISQALLAAAADGLSRKSHTELTSREIAQSAGTTQAMIKYYFDGKDGLFLALIEDSLQGIATALDELCDEVVATAMNPSRPLMALMLRHYGENRALYRVILEELSVSGSPIRERYVRGKLPRNFERMRRIMRSAQGLGIYRPDINPTYMAFAITCFTLGPLGMAPALDSMGLSIEELLGDTWVDSVSEMVDRQFRAQ